jgi:predicted lipid-binding transport protein (Tim44 family)
MRLRTILPILSLLALVSLAVEAGDAWARARSGGSRGSRSYSAPASPAPSNPGVPSTPSRTLGQPSPSPAPSRGFFGGGLMGGIAGFMLGGLLGSMLFGGFGGGFGGGIGLLEILLIGAGVFFLYRWMSKRRQAEQPAYATAGASAYGTAANTGSGGTAVMEMPPAMADLDRGLGHVRQMDPGFDPEALARSAGEVFRKVQTAVALRDMTMLRDRLTPQMHAVLQGQCDELKGSGRTNHVEQIQIERSDVTEIWQEGGQDFATVYLAGTLRDFTVDAAGTVVAGSRTEPEKFAEYWTFTRPVGPSAWKLAAIQTE